MQRIAHCTCLAAGLAMALVAEGVRGQDAALFGGVYDGASKPSEFPLDGENAEMPAGYWFGGHDHATVSDQVGGGHGNGCAHGFWECGGCAGEGALMCSGLRFEYILWWTNGRNAPPLVTSSPLGTVQAEAGVLGFDSTDVLFGEEPIGEQARNGGRLTYSHLLRDQYTFLDVRFWGVEDSSESFAITSDDSPILAIPLFNPTLDAEDALLLSFPGISSDGSVRTLAKNDLIGFDAWLRQTWCADGCTQVDVFAGYQFSRLDDSLALRATTTSIDPLGVPPVGTVFDIRDSFSTQNEFHGVSVGFWSETRHGYTSIELLGKLAIGDMRQAVAISGSTITDEPAAEPAFAGEGLFAQATNSDEFDRHRFVVVPEINVNIGYEFKPSWRATVGYTFIYWSSVVLAGNQIDRTVDLSGLPGAERPQFTFNRTDFWAQGLSFGIEHRW